MNAGNSPYETKPNTKNIRFDQGSQIEQLNQYKQEETGHKADKILPHELQNITSLLGDTFVSLTDIRNMLDTAEQNTELNKHVIDSIKEKIDEINKIVLEIPEDLAKIGI